MLIGNFFKKINPEFKNHYFSGINFNSQSCKKNDIFCIDLFNKIEFTKDDLYDLVHASPKGSNTIANKIFDEITLIINNF